MKALRRIGRPAPAGGRTDRNLAVDAKGSRCYGCGKNKISSRCTLHAE
jgi:hypothetical protein